MSGFLSHPLFICHEKKNTLFPHLGDGRVGLAGDRRGDPRHTNNSLRKLLSYMLQRFLSTHIDIQNSDTNPGFKGS